jgi:ribonuclease Z
VRVAELDLQQLLDEFLMRIRCFKVGIIACYTHLTASASKEMMWHLEQAFQFDIRIRLYDDRPPPQWVVVLAEEITEGVVYEHQGVTVMAFEVDHAPLKPAFGYRIDYAGRSVVLSGDTRVNDNLILFVQGADLLVHEVVAPELQRRLFQSNVEWAQRIIAHHTTPEQAGTVFTRVRPKLAVYSHILPVVATADDLIPPTRKTYAGPLEAGEDPMCIDILSTPLERYPQHHLRSG